VDSSLYPCYTGRRSCFVKKNLKRYQHHHIGVGKLPDTHYPNPKYSDPDPNYPNPHYPKYNSDS
jgi:hypothetical protein